MGKYLSTGFIVTVLLASGGLCIVSAEIDKTNSRGVATGYLSQCLSGINKPSMITQKHLRKLTVSTLAEGGMFAKRNTYTYFQVKKIINDPFIDFKNKPTFIFTPGYLDLGINSHVSQSIGVYYKDLGYNVLLLDLSEFSIMEYPKAVRLLRPLGFHIAEMISNLTSIGLNPKTLNLMGVSLGGQTVSFAAKYYKQLTGKTFGQLTALDPAGPCFRDQGPESRLDTTDADYVEIINTNIDGFGFGLPVGHVNFYVNGGEYQPLDLALWWPCEIICSHIKVGAYWVAAMENPDKFFGVKCKSVQHARERDCFNNVPMITNIMGPKTNKSKEGIFFVPTTNKYPYYLGKRGLKKENDFIDKQLKDIIKEDVMVF